MATLYPVLLAGGSGTRLWPVSRKSYPKQFSKLIGDQSLFQATACRFRADGYAAPLVLTSEDFRFIVTEQLAALELDATGILVEPEGRNTAPAILAAAVWLAARDPDAVMLVAPSDHVLPDDAAFRAAVAAALPHAQAGDLLTFGIRPDRPETGYGYLELADAQATLADTPQPLTRFVEKPGHAQAQTLLDQGNVLWNAGIFLFTAKAILDAFRVHAPAMLAPVQKALCRTCRDMGFTRLAPEPWGALPDISIDYAIMERADNLRVMPYCGGWNDLGGWDAVWRETRGDSADGTVVSGTAHAIDCKNSLLRSDTPDLQLVGLGLTDIVAVAMRDAVLVAHRSQAQRVREAVDLLRAREAPQAEQFPREHRPWGWFESLIVGNRFQVKRIHVHPGAALSMQSHHHRSEHWIVVEGTARVTVGNAVTLVTENQSAYVPLGVEHRMENPGKVPMVLVEVQTGSYLGEDDIVRYEDIYARGQVANG